MPHPPRLRRRQHGFTLIEIALVMAILGVLAMLAAAGVHGYVNDAKTAEAYNGLGGVRLALASSFASRQTLCGNSNPVPALLANVTAKKYQPSAAPGMDYESGDNNTGWKCIKYSAEMPQYFQYQYGLGQFPGGGGAPDFYVWARSDLQGDGTLTWLVLRGKSGNDVLYFAPSIANFP